MGVGKFADFDGFFGSRKAAVEKKPQHRFRAWV